ncbi:hypothetical protein [Arthrobacter sp. NPDC056727]|uniref:hypothetical protein n=1 Tax=Arthrobacter sp. NPDC056727 TaxID=3345927 RepID=UPI00366D9F9E
MTLEPLEVELPARGADRTENENRRADPRDGMAAVLASHPGYSWVWTDEIRCQGKECGARLEIPLLNSTQLVAHAAFADHQEKYLQQSLALSRAVS